MKINDTANQDVPSGYKRTEVGVIPTDWEDRSLAQLGGFLAGAGFPIRYQGSVSGDFPFFKVSDMNTPGNELFMCQANHYITEEIRNKLNAIRVPRESIVFAKIGAAIFLERKRLLAQDSCIDNNMMAFKPEVGLVSLRYMYYVLLHQSFGELVATTALPSLSSRQLGVIRVAVPPPSEQHAIAEALSDVDALLKSLDALITKKKAIKLAALQQLLTGKTRLPGFSGEWERKRLGEIAEIVMGQSPSSAFYNSRGVGLPLIQGNADVEGRKTIKRFYTSQVTKRGRKGDVLMSVRAPVGEISRATFDLCLGRGVCALRFPNDFLFHYLIYLEPSWSRHSKGSTFDSVNSADVRSVEIEMPSSSTEQLAVATVLSNMDTEITALEARREKTRAIKEGMMQQLLTGRVRLIAPEQRETTG